MKSNPPYDLLVGLDKALMVGVSGHFLNPKLFQFVKELLGLE